MGSRSLAQTTSAKNSDTAPLQNQVTLRPFVAQAETASFEQQELPDVQAQLETAKQFGHRFADAANPRANEMKVRSSLPLLQPKLTIGAPGDKYEQEADRVAQQVVQRLHAPQVRLSPLNQTLQRESAPEEEELQMKPVISLIQRQELDADEDEAEELQMKPLVQRQESGGGDEASTDLESSIQQARGSGQSLDTSIRQPMEQAFGAGFGGVRIHTDAHADGLNRSLQSRAFATKQDIFFKRGEYNPSTKGGQELIAHELTHVVQQGSAQVQRSGDPIIQRELVESPMHSNAEKRASNPKDKYFTKEVNETQREFVRFDTDDYPQIDAGDLGKYNEKVLENPAADVSAEYKARSSGDVYSSPDQSGLVINVHPGGKLMTVGSAGSMSAENVRKSSLPKNQGGMGECNPQHVNSHYDPVPWAHNHYVFPDGNYTAPLEKLINAAEAKPGVLGANYKNDRKPELVDWNEVRRVGDEIRTTFGLPAKHNQASN
jgi:hypothetical protein